MIEVDSAPVSHEYETPLGKSLELEKTTNIARRPVDASLQQPETNAAYDPFSSWVLVDSGFEEAGKEIWVDVKGQILLTKSICFRVRASVGVGFEFAQPKLPFLEGRNTFRISVSYSRFSYLFWKKDLSVDLVYFSDDRVTNSFAVGTLCYDKEEARWGWVKAPSA